MNGFYFCKCADVKRTVHAISLLGAKAVLLDANAVRSDRHFEAAHELAKIAFEAGENISENMGNEILLFISCQKNVKNAIERCGARDGLPALLAVYGEMGKPDFGKIHAEGIDAKFPGCVDTELLQIIEKMAIARV